MNKLAQKLENLTYTDNNALTNKSTLNQVLDLFGSIGAMRNRKDPQIIEAFMKAYEVEPLLALKTLFYARDIRCGQGERRTFRVILKHLANELPETVVKNFDNIVEFGRWDDMFALIGTPIENQALDFVAKQFIKDVAVMAKPKAAKENKLTVSLLGKWLPSENTSSKETRKLANKVRGHFNKINPISSKEYRQTLSQLREVIRVVERKMCSNQWGEIDYSKLPSKAGLNYRRAFFKHDSERYKKFLDDVSTGKVKINTGVLYPYDIVGQIMDPYQMEYTGTPPNGSYNPKARDLTSENRLALDTFWRNLPNYLENRPHNGLVVCDTSGSMKGQPIAVAISLAIYFAERNVGNFKDYFVTFSKNPQFQKVNGKDIYEKVANLSKSQWDQNTNLQAVFDLVLDSAKENKVSPDEMPDTIYIVSDMEFDTATQQNTRTNFQEIKAKYDNSGYKMPELVFWNVNARNSQSPITINDVGTKLVSGCSPNILTTLLDGKTMTAVDTMLLKINSERYEKIVK